jgi:hypothetical protein
VFDLNPRVRVGSGTLEHSECVPASQAGCREQLGASWHATLFSAKRLLYVVRSDSSANECPLISLFSAV